MQDITPITPRDKATAERRRRDFERRARSLAEGFWTEPTAFVENLKKALEVAYVEGAEDQQFPTRRSVA